MTRVIHIHESAPAKPRWGQPCNGCGVCCTLEPCPVGILVSKRRTGRCDALVWIESASVYRCGVITQPDRFLGLKSPLLQRAATRLARRMISAGSGCDCDHDTENVAG